MKLNKPKFWDKKKPNLISYLLFPFTIIIRINNIIINKYKKFKTKKIKSICVGNIYIGGTGKTPLTIKLFKLISNINKKTIVAKKFYSSHKDEILILKKNTKLITDKNRFDLIKKAIYQKFEIIIFDDGLQDKTIDYSLKFVCFDSLNWIGNGKLLPAGPLRQEIKVLKNFDAVFFKSIRNINKQAVKLIKRINPKINIFNYNLEIIDKNKFDLSKKYFVMSGIGNSESFSKFLKFNKFKIQKHIEFPDHHQYTEDEISDVTHDAKIANSKILTTEKDYVKIPKKYIRAFKCIKVSVILENEKKLINFLKLKINE